MTLTDAADQPGPNVPEYTVSELSLALKRTVEGAYERVRVRGELSGVKRAASVLPVFVDREPTTLLEATTHQSRFRVGSCRKERLTRCALETGIECAATVEPVGYRHLEGA